MIAGHLQEKKGLFYMLLNYKDEQGKRNPKWIPTGLTVKGNKKKAEALLLETRRNFEAAAQEPIKEEPNVPAAVVEEMNTVAIDQTLFEVAGDRKAYY
ncbi:hypothetical protein D3C75_635650 [compost metagenome]